MKRGLVKMTEEMKERTLGVEVEFTGITRSAVGTILRKYFSSESFHYGGQYDEYRVKDSQGRTWKVMHDGSISPQKNYHGNISWMNSSSVSGRIRKCELVTPILTWKDIETLQDIVERIENAGGIVNSSCGIHIHIGADCFSIEKLKDLVNLMTSKEDLIYKALDIHPDRIVFCKKTDRIFLQKLNENNPKEKTELAKIWYNTEHPEWHTHHYDDTRYTHTNLHAYFTKGTVEFRLFNSTLNPTLIKSYIQFCLAVVARVLTTKKPIRYKETIIENEKFQMRSWLRQLGLNGEEYRDCRYTFLNKLTGDLANRKVG